MNKQIKTQKYLKMRKRMVAGGVIALGLALGGMGVAEAASTPGSSPMSSIVTAIATKFNLNAADVQAVIDEQMATERASMEKEHATKLSERLATGVSEGKLTQAQADLITAKMAEIEASHKANMSVVDGKPSKEHMAAMKKEMDALKQWIADNNIPEEFMMVRFGGGGMEMKAGVRGERHIMKSNVMFEEKAQ